MSAPVPSDVLAMADRLRTVIDDHFEGKEAKLIKGTTLSQTSVNRALNPARNPAAKEKTYRERINEILKETERVIRLNPKWVETGEGPTFLNSTQNDLDSYGGDGDLGASPPPFHLAEIAKMVDSVEYRAGEGSPLVVSTGVSVRDSRRAWRLPDGGPVDFVDSVAPSDAHRGRGIYPGSQLDLQLHKVYDGAGMYMVAFGETAEMFYVHKTPSGGFTFRTDEERFHVEPDETHGFVSVDTGRPARFAFMARLLGAMQTYSAPRRPIAR